MTFSVVITQTRIACNRASKKPQSHDNYFHSVLGLLDIQTEVYKTELDVYDRCRVNNANTNKINWHKSD